MAPELPSAEGSIIGWIVLVHVYESDEDEVGRWEQISETLHPTMADADRERFAFDADHDFAPWDKATKTCYVKAQLLADTVDALLGGA